MTPRWNRNYTTFDETGEPSQSEWYKSMNYYERFENAQFFWDIDHTCNRLEPLEEWVAEHRFFPLGWEGRLKRYTVRPRIAGRHKGISFSECLLVGHSRGRIDEIPN